MSVMHTTLLLLLLLTVLGRELRHLVNTRQEPLLCARLTCVFDGFALFLAVLGRERWHLLE